jgi:3-oxoacyl-[acyl-carrier protein] reductase
VSAVSERVALVTGVSRTNGIGFAAVERLLDDGLHVLVHSWSAHDAEQPWGGQPLAEVLDALGGVGPRLAHVEADLGDPGAPARVVAAAVERFGRLDVLVANHAHSARGGLADVTAADLDRAWAVNARGSVLLAQAFAAQFDAARGDGRVVLFTSGQHLGPMPHELPYTISKGAIHQMTWTLADALADRGITVNAVNPGPVDTGYADDELRAALAPAFPAGRWGAPADVAPLVAWLASRESRWVTGQILNAEGGFRRHLA